MSLYRVDKREQPIALYLSDKVVQQGIVFLSPFASTHSGEETLLDLLREKEPFFPFRDQEGRFLLVNKNAVTHVAFRASQPQTPPWGTPLKVRITFFGGERIEGTIILNMPDGKNRLLDYINAAPGFFALEGDDVQYVANGNLVREISPL